MQRRPDSQIGMSHSTGAAPRVTPRAILILVQWFLIWGGYNITIGHVLSPGFPANRLDLVQGMRVFLPLLSGWTALLVILARRGLKTQAVAGPLGLLAFFTVIGIVSSMFLSPYPIRAVCWGCEFGAVIIVLMVVLSDSDAPRIISRLITFNWIIDICLMVAIIAAIPFLGAAAVGTTQGSPLGVIVYHGGATANSSMLGMATSRNTGLARYAGVAGLVALARILQGNRWTKFVWMGILLVALYALVLAQARTETLSFVAGVLIVLMLRKHRRVVVIGAGVLGTLLMGLVGFFQAAWNFGTRAQGFDPTLTGRTHIWGQALQVIWRSPWVGFGFRADRYFVHQDMQNSFLHAWIEAGTLGAIAYTAAFALAWYLIKRLYTSRRSNSLSDEIPGILMFFTVMSITETAAWYSANWLLLGPALAYIQVFAWQEKVQRARSSYASRSQNPFHNPTMALPHVHATKKQDIIGHPCQTDI